VHVCVRERGIVCVDVCVRGKERDSVCVCVCMCVREGKREIERARERESVCVCVSQVEIMRDSCTESVARNIEVAI